MNGPGLRRAMHALTAAVLVVVPLGSWAALRWFLVVAALLAGAVELLRLRLPAVGRSLARWVPVFRPREATRPSGAMWLWWGYALAGWFPPPAPAAGILVAAFADPAASLAGQFGPAPLRPGKTWRGTAAAAVTAGVVLWLLGYAPPTMGAAAVTAALLERWSGPADDNLVVAPAVAAAVHFLS